MIAIEDYSTLIPLRAGRIVGCASYRGEYILIACEHGLFKVWDDGVFSTCITETAQNEHDHGIVR